MFLLSGVTKCVLIDFAPDIPADVFFRVGGDCKNKRITR